MAAKRVGHRRPVDGRRRATSVRLFLKRVAVARRDARRAQHPRRAAFDACRQTARARSGRAAGVPARRTSVGDGFRPERAGVTALPAALQSGDAPAVLARRAPRAERRRRHRRDRARRHRRAIHPLRRGREAVRRRCRGDRRPAAPRPPPARSRLADLAARRRRRGRSGRHLVLTRLGDGHGRPRARVRDRMAEHTRSAHGARAPPDGAALGRGHAHGRHRRQELDVSGHAAIHGRLLGDRLPATAVRVVVERDLALGTGRQLLPRPGAAQISMAGGVRGLDDRRDGGARTRAASNGVAAGRAGSRVSRSRHRATVSLPRSTRLRSAADRDPRGCRWCRVARSISVRGCIRR